MAEEIANIVRDAVDQGRRDQHPGEQVAGLQGDQPQGNAGEHQAPQVRDQAQVRAGNEQAPVQAEGQEVNILTNL